MSLPTHLQIHEDITLMGILANRTKLIPSDNDYRSSGAAVIYDGMVSGRSKEDPGKGSDSRTARVLDALAQVCLSREKGEVYAVAVAPPSPTGGNGYLFTFASNGEFDSSTKTYLSNLLEILRKLARAFHAEVPKVDASSHTPPNVLSNRSAATNKIINDAYDLMFLNTLGKMYARLGKRQKFYEDIKLALEEHPKIQKYEKLQRVMHAVGNVYMAFDKTNSLARARDEANFRYTWSYFLRELATSTAALFSDTDMPPDVENFLEGKCWSKPRGKRGSQTIKIRAQVIKKLALIPQSESALIKWAASPRLRHAFEKDFTLSYLDGPVTVGVSRDTLGSLPALRERLNELSGLPADNTKLTSALAKDGDLKNWFSVTPPVHAECAIVLHAAKKGLLSQANRYSNYIGVSKLSCYCCDAFLRHFGNLTKMTWTTRGCHQKLYPWGVITLDMQQKDSLRDTAVAMVHADVQRLFQERCSLRFGDNPPSMSARSDSSATSGEGGGDTNATEPMDDMVRVLRGL